MAGDEAIIPHFVSAHLVLLVLRWQGAEKVRITQEDHDRDRPEVSRACVAICFISSTVDVDSLVIPFLDDSDTERIIAPDEPKIHCARAMLLRGRSAD